MSAGAESVAADVVPFGKAEEAQQMDSALGGEECSGGGGATGDGWGVGRAAACVACVCCGSTHRTLPPGASAKLCAQAVAIAAPLAAVCGKLCGSCVPQAVTKESPTG